jgi:hypothetical protein
VIREDRKAPPFPSARVLRVADGAPIGGKRHGSKGAKARQVGPAVTTVPPTAG